MCRLCKTHLSLPNVEYVCVRACVRACVRVCEDVYNSFIQNKRYPTLKEYSNFTIEVFEPPGGYSIY